MKISGKLMLAATGAALVLSAGLALAGPGKFGKGHGPGDCPQGATRAAQLMPAFERMDADGDGVITRKEARAFREQLFASKDTNGDGRLDARELDAAIGERMRRGQVRMRYNWLARQDVNGDGAIDREEFVQGGERRFARLDADGDGRVTREEMARMRGTMRGAPAWRGRGGPGAGAQQ